MKSTEDTSSVQYMLGVLVSKVEELSKGIEEYKRGSALAFSKTEQRIDKIEARTAALEKSWWKLLGISSVIPTVLTVVGLVLAYVAL